MATNTHHNNLEKEKPIAHQLSRLLIWCVEVLQKKEARRLL
jgi:hypothetical protein